jgi:hypothetical protein
MEGSMSGQATKDRMFGVLLLSSLIASLIAGISARIDMRIVALTAHMPLQFTSGTFNVVFFGFTLGMIAGFVYAPTIVVLSASPRFRKYLPGPIWRGLTFGVLILAISGLLSLLVPVLSPQDISLGIPLLNKLMFAALPLIFGITLGGAEKILDCSLPGKSVSSEGEIKSPPV